MLCGIQQQGRHDRGSQEIFWEYKEMEYQGVYVLKAEHGNVSVLYSMIQLNTEISILLYIIASESKL